LEAITAELREQLADMTVQRDRWQQVEAVNRQICLPRRPVPAACFF
jgi:hypothetical protein